MLQVTDAAATVFKSILDLEDVEGSAIRLAPSPSPEEGVVGVSFQAVGGPDENDHATAATGVDVYVAPELVKPLDTAVLDARDTDQGAELYLRPQESIDS